MPRTEAEIFSELSQLCHTAGFAHVIALLCFRDNMVGFSDELTAKNIAAMHSPERLIRTEISTLIGLLIQEQISLEVPTPSALMNHTKQTETLLGELHEALSRPMRESVLRAIETKSEENPFRSGDVLREPIFYGAESAYSFQYLDLAAKRYRPDRSWLIAKKGFDPEQAQKVISAIGELHEQKLNRIIGAIPEILPDSQTILRAFTHDIQEIAETAQLSAIETKSVLEAFSVSSLPTNENFEALSDFNLANACPLIRVSEGSYLLFQYASLAEAFYESPFYWFAADTEYFPTATINRGKFTETFCFHRLRLAFGASNVFANVDLYEAKGKKAGEIDILVRFADRIIVVQAKSKRLTLGARKGNDGILRDDFAKSVQSSYDQAVLCAEKILQGGVTLRDSDGNEIRLARALSEIYPVCVVSDHYPALAFQAQQFLTIKKVNSILPPLVLDVFALDVMTEFLQSPLYLLSYLNRRARYHEKVHASNEMTILSYHLKRNLWVEEADYVQLTDDISADLDAALIVRRLGVPGNHTPDGILTKMQSGPLGFIIRQIETLPDPAVVNLGFLLLSLGENTCIAINRGLEQVSKLSRSDGKNHDFTVGIKEAGEGITFHCNEDTPDRAGPRLERHMAIRKYSERSNSWFGVCVSPGLKLRFGLNLHAEWQQDPAMDKLLEQLPVTGASMKAFIKSRDRKIGRNEQCPCGSGKKFKKCCLLN